jgi:hypothetical protein
MSDPTRASNFRDALERHREYRRELETLVMPLASSLDGRRFSFQAPLRGLRLEVGGYVVLEAESVTRLGQIVALREDRIDAGASGSRSILVDGIRTSKPTSPYATPAVRARF